MCMTARGGPPVKGIDDDSLLERLDRRRGIPALGEAGGELEQQPQVRLAHRVAPAGCRTPLSDPRRAAPRRTARAPPHRIRRLTGLAGTHHGRLEDVNVDLHPPARKQRQHVVTQRKHRRSLRAGRLQCPPSDIQRLMEIIGRRLRRPLRPQHLGRPLPMDPTLRRQREQLHQALGLTQPPRALRYHHLADTNRERAKQPNPHGIIHPCTHTTQSAHGPIPERHGRRHRPPRVAGFADDPVAVTAARKRIVEEDAARRPVAVATGPTPRWPARCECACADHACTTAEARKSSTRAHRTSRAIRSVSSGPMRSCRARDQLVAIRSRHGG